MYYLYPTVSTDSACTRVSAVTYALICPHPDWLYRLRAAAVSRHLVLERESSLIFRKSNPITHPRPALLLSLSFFLSGVLHRDNRVSSLRREPSFSAHLVGNGINSPASFSCAGRVSLVARQLYLFIRRIGHASRASLKIAPPAPRDDSPRLSRSIGIARLALSSACV